MDLERCRLKNFQSFKEETWDLRGVHVALICGPNGEGKSSLLDSIPFCFWGEGRGSKLSDFINEDADTVLVEWIFLMEGNRYRKLRQHGEDGNINELYIDANTGTLEEAEWRLISDDNKRSTDQLLTSILGLNYQLSQNSNFFGQDDKSSLVTGGGPERKELLCEMLDVPFYKEAAKDATEKANELDNKITLKLATVRDKESLLKRRPEIEASISANERETESHSLLVSALNEQITVESQSLSEIEGKIRDQANDRKRLVSLQEQAASARNRVKQLERDLTKNQTDIDRLVDDGTRAIEELQLQIDKVPELESQIETLKADIKSLEGERDKLVSLKQSAQGLSDKRDLIRTEITTFETKIREIDSRIDRIKKSGALCPILGHQCDLLGDENKSKSIGELDRNKSSLQDQIQRSQDELEQNRLDVISCEGTITQVNERLKKELAFKVKLEAAEKSLTSAMKASEDLPKKKQDLRKRMDELEANEVRLDADISATNLTIPQLESDTEEILASLKDDHSADLLKSQRKMAALKNDLEELRSKERLIMRRAGELKVELESIVHLESDIAQIKTQVDVLKTDHRIYTELAFAFGKNGIQKEVIGGAVPIIEAKSNELLAQFRGDDRVNIKFDLDPVTSKGNAKKSGGLDISISNDGRRPRLFDMYSGGERVRITFSILFAVSKLLTSRAGKRSETLIIDERIAELDSNGIEQFIGIIRQIAPEFKKILIVSHIDQLKQSFNQQFVVSKTDALGSKVALVN